MTAALAVAGLIAFMTLHDWGLRLRNALNDDIDEGNRMTSVALLARTYAEMHDGLWPALASSHPPFTFESGSVPDGLAIGERLRFPLDSPVSTLLIGHLNNHKAYTLNRLDLTDCWYLGYAVTNEREALALIDTVQDNQPREDHIEVGPGRGTLGSHRLYRLHNNLSDRLLEDGVIQDEDSGLAARIPVLIQRPAEARAWVAFLDGHAELLPYPSAFPLTAAIVNGLENAAK